MDEEAYKKELAENGVDLPELKEEPKPEPEEEKAEEPAKSEEPEKEPEDKDTAHLQEPKEQRKRSIYDEYKEKKAELRSEREARQTLENEVADLRSKLEALSSASTPEEKKDAQDDLDAFAKEIQADPAAIRKMRDLFLKDIKPSTDDALAKDLADFKEWKKSNQQVIEQQMFEKEFATVQPSLKEMFPSASDAEMGALKSELDKLSHSKAWHDKDLDYVVFKNKEHLSAFISPKKRSIETKSRKDVEAVEQDFDPNADLSKMSIKQREQWEEQYRKAGKTDELSADAQGRKILI